MAISSYKVELLKCETSGENYTKFADIKDFPDLFGDPNTIETTTLSDNQQTFKTSDTLSFTLNWDKTIASQIIELEGKDTKWKVQFSDGAAFTFSGAASLGVPGKGVDEVLEMTLNIVPSTVVTYVQGA